VYEMAAEGYGNKAKLTVAGNTSYTAIRGIRPPSELELGIRGVYATMIDLCSAGLRCTDSNGRPSLRLAYGG
jgi:hypothetical protein